MCADSVISEVYVFDSLIGVGWNRVLAGIGIQNIPLPMGTQV